MTEQDYTEAIANIISPEGDIPLEAISLIDAAVQAHPASASLWQQRAHLIQLGPEDSPHPLEEVLASYQRALEIDPENEDILEDIAHFHYAVMDDEIEALKWFAKAASMKYCERE